MRHGRSGVVNKVKFWWWGRGTVSGLPGRAGEDLFDGGEYMAVLCYSASAGFDFDNLSSDITEAAAAGFGGLELNFEAVMRHLSRGGSFLELRTRVDATGLELVAAGEIYLYPEYGTQLYQEEEQLNALNDRLALMYEFFHQLHCRRCVVMPPRVASAEDWALFTEYRITSDCVRILRLFIDQMSYIDWLLCPVRGDFSMVKSASRGLEIAACVGSPKAGTLVDLALIEDNGPEQLKACADNIWVKLVRLSGDEQRDLHFLRALVELGCKAPLASPEIEPAPGEAQGAFIRRLFAYTKNTAQKAGYL